MDNDRWEQIKENIKSKFKVLEEGIEDLTVTTGEGEIKSGTAAFLVAETPMGKIKLSFESRPLVLDKKLIYSHQQGKSARTEYTFSDTELTHKIKAYKWNPDALVGAGDDDEWQEMDAEAYS